MLTALYQRERTGKGTALEVSLFDALGEWMSYPAYYAAYTDASPRRTGAEHATIAPYGPFQAGDGKLVTLGVQNEREWERFCGVVLEQPEIAVDPRFDRNSKRVANREAPGYTIIDAVFGQLSVAEVIARLEVAQIANARINTMQEFGEHPATCSSPALAQGGFSGGADQSSAPTSDDARRGSAHGPVPAVGQHTEAILQELGVYGRANQPIAGRRRYLKGESKEESAYANERGLAWPVL